MVEFPLAGLKISITQPLAWACDEPANSAPLLLLHTQRSKTPGTSVHPQARMQNTAKMSKSLLNAS